MIADNCKPEKENRSGRDNYGFTGALSLCKTEIPARSSRLRPQGVS